MAFPSYVYCISWDTDNTPTWVDTLKTIVTPYRWSCFMRTGRANQNMYRVRDQCFPCTIDNDIGCKLVVALLIAENRHPRHIIENVKISIETWFFRTFFISSGWFWNNLQFVFFFSSVIMFFSFLSSWCRPCSNAFTSCNVHWYANIETCFLKQTNDVFKLILSV
jgi:hypothetical protein